MYTTLSTIVLCALLNRAAGSKFFDTLKSSLVSRILATGLMALALSNVILWPFLLLWRTLAGSSDASAALHGHALDGKVKYLNWATKWLKEDTENRRRIKGSVRMGLKHLSLLPIAYVVGGMWYLVPLIGLIYYFVGLVVSDSRALAVVEILVGAAICIILL